MRRIYEYFILFVKENFVNKMALFWTFFLPLVFIIVNNLSWFSELPDNYFHTLALFLSFIVLLSAINGVGIALLISRENGFLKVFSFISGSIKHIVIGKILAQFAFLLFNLLLFTFIVSILFQLNTFLLVGVSFIVCLVVGIPTFLIVLWIPILPFKQENVVPVFTLLNFLLIFLATINFENSIFNFLFTIVNPAAVANQFAIYVYRVLNEGFIYNGIVIDVFVAILLYAVIGYMFMKKIRVTSAVQRG